MSAEAGVIFDFGFTLVDHRIAPAGCLTTALKACGIHLSRARILAATPPEPLRIASCPPKLAACLWSNSLLTYYGSWLARLGLDRPQTTTLRLCRDVISAYERPDNWGPRPGGKELLIACRRRGWAVGILSNWGPNLERTVQALGWSSLFDVIQASGNSGWAKPDPGAFLTAASALGIHPHRICFVGDQLETDCKAAQRVGMKALLVSDRANPKATTIRQVRTLRSARRSLADLLRSSAPRHQPAGTC